MAGEITITVTGNATGDPELRFLPDGTPVASFTVANNPRRYDRVTGKWEDTEPSFVRVSAFRQLAENVAESIGKGDRVTVVGAFAERRWEDKETGEKRAAWQLTAETVAASLDFATVTIKRTARRETVPPGDAWATASRTRPSTPADSPT